MANLIAVCIVLLYCLLKWEQQKLKKLNNMLKIEQMRNREILSMVTQANQCSIDVSNSAKRICIVNAQLLTRCGELTKKLDQLEKALDLERSKTAVQDVHLDILKRRTENG